MRIRCWGKVSLVSFWANYGNYKGILFSTTYSDPAYSDPALVGSGICSGEVNYAALGIASNSPKQSNQLGIYIEPNSVDCVVNHNSNSVPGTLNNKILNPKP